jgi:hypothetical protein
MRDIDHLMDKKIFNSSKLQQSQIVGFKCAYLQYAMVNEVISLNFCDPDIYVGDYGYQS